MKKLITLALATASLVAAAAPQDEVLVGTIKVTGVKSWWNAKTDLNPLRLAPPQEGAEIRYYDINGDGKPEVLRTVTIDGYPIQWIDDDHNMKVGDLAGDMVNDCLMIDRNKDGEYGSWSDLIIDWSDNDGDGKADVQFIIENVAEGAKKPGGHYMAVIDDDHDGVFNYVDWNTFKLRCWLHNGLADFYTDYIGNSTFLKNHNTPERMRDIKLNWENPFVFRDPDGDGLTEYTIRLCDAGGAGDRGRNPNGNMNWAAYCFDLDNDNNPENPLDLDMTIHFLAKEGTPYTKYVHEYKNMRGLPEADRYFRFPEWRQNSTLIFPDYSQCHDFVFKDAKWEQVWFCFDEDGDCKRWERVELYQPRDLWAVGEKNGGLDNNRQADAIGDRGEWDMDNSGNGNLYVSPMDGKIHLYGAEWGAWRIDQRSQHYQNMGGIYDVYGPKRQEDENGPFPVIKYEDTDGNGFFDKMLCDWNFDKEFEEVIDLKALGLCDKAEVIKIADFKYEDYTALYQKVAEASWFQAEAAIRKAAELGLDTGWYALYKSPKSLRQKYEYGYWLQLYIYHDIVDLARRNGDAALEKEAARAFFSQSWAFSSSPVPAEVWARMQGKSFKTGCGVNQSDLRYVRCLHKDASGRTLDGEMVVNKAIAEDVVDILIKLFDAAYPIQSIRLVDDFDASDEKSMSANNSSAFNFRLISGTKKVSKHGLGMAVDINPLYNPYVRTLKNGKTIVEPLKGAAYTDRSKASDYKIVRDDLCCRLFLEHGFTWGGDWKSVKDYQHFEK